MKMHLSFRVLETQVTAILALFRTLLIILTLMAMTACDSELSDFESRQVNAALSDSLFTVTESWGLSMEVIEDGKLKLKLDAAYAASINNEYENMTKLGGPVHIEIYDENGKIDTIVEADSAVHHPTTSEFEMFDNVKVFAPGGKRLYSDYLKWQRSEDKVSTPEFVIFISPPDSISATGFVGNSDLTNYTLNEGGGRVIID